MRIEVIRNDSYDEIAPLVKKHFVPDAQLMTDQHAVYKKLGPEFSGHEFVNHGENEFAKGPVHNNTAESVNAIIEKVNKGVFHQWSRKHLHRYLNEIAFRWNQRKETEKPRRAVWLLTRRTPMPLFCA